MSEIVLIVSGGSYGMQTSLLPVSTRRRTWERILEVSALRLMPAAANVRTIPMPPQ